MFFKFTVLENLAIILSDSTSTKNCVNTYVNKRTNSVDPANLLEICKQMLQQKNKYYRNTFLRSVLFVFGGFCLKLRVLLTFIVITSK